MCEIGKEVFYVVRFGTDGETTLRYKIKRLFRAWRAASVREAIKEDSQDIGLHVCLDPISIIQPSV